MLLEVGRWGAKRELFAGFQGLVSGSEAGATRYAFKERGEAQGG